MKDEVTLRNKYKDHTQARLLDTVIELEKKVEELEYEMFNLHEQIGSLSYE